MVPKPVFGLVCTGGGAHGAYQVGALKFIHEKFSRDQQSPFQIFTGASCGALNTTFYATHSHDAYKSRLWLEELWKDFHVPAYHGNIFKNALISLYKEWRKKPSDRSTAWALLDSQPLWDILKKGFHREDFDRALKHKTTLGAAIACTEILSGRACWFQEGEKAKNWNLFHSQGIVDSLQMAHLAASCSVPFFLPPVKIGEHYFLDGSISLDKPLASAMIMGATRILSIATEKPASTALPDMPSRFRPRISNIVRLLLNRLSRNGSQDEAVEIRMLNRFHRALARRHRKRSEEPSAPPLFHEEAAPSHYAPVEVFTFFPSKRILEAYASAMPPKTKAPRTRFMFHERFIREMMEFGYQDAKSREAEFTRFFHPEALRKRWFFSKTRKLNSHE